MTDLTSSQTPETPELPKIVNMRRYRHRPGDKLIVRVNKRTTDFDNDWILSLISMQLDVPRDDVLIMSEGADIKVLKAVRDDVVFTIPHGCLCEWRIGAGRAPVRRIMPECKVDHDA